MPAGSVRISVTIQDSTELECTGFYTPYNQTVIVVMNTNDKAIPFKLYDTLHDQAVNITAIPRSIQTFWY